MNNKKTNIYHTPVSVSNWALKCWLLLVVVFGTTTVFAQKNDLDSLRKKQDEAVKKNSYNAQFIRYTSLSLLKDSILLLPIDTIQTEFRFSGTGETPISPQIKIGGYGQPIRPLLFTPSSRIGFDLGRHNWDIFKLSSEKVNYYRARVPYSELTYVSSGGVEDHFKVLLTQNFNKNFNMGANFNRSSSDGFFANQKTSLLGAALFAWFGSSNQRYQLFANMTTNDIRNQENGSLVLDSIFDKGTNVPKNALQTKLSTAQNHQKDVSFFVKHFFDIGPTGTRSPSNLATKQRITHTFILRQSDFYFDKNEADTYKIFAQNTLNSITTNDALKLNQTQNELNYAFTIKSKRLKNEIKLNVGVLQDFYHLSQADTTRNFYNTTAKAALNYQFTHHLQLEAQAEQIVLGNNVGDYHIGIQTAFQLQANRLMMSASLVNQSPEFLYQNQQSNHYSWQNNFSKTQINQYTIAFQSEKWHLHLGSNYYLMNHYLYFRENNLQQPVPFQQNSAIHLWQFFIRKQFNLWRFSLDNYLVYQQSNELTSLNTPQFYEWHSLYYRDLFFKVLYLHTGIDLQYHNRFNNPSYNPALGQFYVSQQAALNTIPLLSVWANATLKKANLFVKYEYLNQGYGNKGYYLTNSYPMPDAMIRFGVLWRFYE